MKNGVENKRFAFIILFSVFRQIGDQRIHFKVKVTLILCVFSGSDVGSKCQLLYSLLHPTTEHLNCLTLSVVSLKYSSGPPRVSFFKVTVILDRFPLLFPWRCVMLVTV